MNIISEVLSACVSSAKAEPMKLKLPSGKYFSIPGQVNVMLNMPSGAGKSTYISEVEDRDFVKLIDFSMPALIGSIDEKGEIVPGYLIKAAGKVLWIDESHRIRPSAQAALLSVLERQWASRILGRSVRRKTTVRRKFVKASTIDNEIRIDYVRLSVLMSGLFSPHKKKKATLDDNALASRFLHLTLKTTFDDLDDISLGKRFFSINKTEYVDTPVFDDFPKFVSCYREVINNLPKNMNDFLRGSNEFYQREKLQISRLLGWASRGNSVVDDWEKYIPYIPFFIYSTVASTLTHSEFEVYNHMDSDASQKDIASLLGVTEVHVSNTIKKLRGVGLVK